MNEAAHIKAGYHPGLIGQITSLHARYYAEHHGFGPVFEARVAAGLADFVQRLPHPRNGIWSVQQHGTCCGSIAIDGEDLGGNAAHLRWFILDETLRGAGWGKILLKAALDHCQHHGFSAVHLWTFAGLDAARKRYEAHGFVLKESVSGTQWGTPVTEQHWVKSLVEQG